MIRGEWGLVRFEAGRRGLEARRHAETHAGSHTGREVGRQADWQGGSETRVRGAPPCIGTFWSRVQGWTINLRRPERARNEGSSGPERL